MAQTIACHVAQDPIRPRKSASRQLKTLEALAAIAVGMRIAAPPRTDPGGRDSRTGLPPWVV
jgi:hypothetical protein